MSAALIPLLLPPILCFLTVDYVPGETAHRGRVVAAPHDGYDQYSGDICKSVAQRLGWDDARREREITTARERLTRDLAFLGESP